mgnify:CR=1 FL=1
MLTICDTCVTDKRRCCSHSTAPASDCRPSKNNPNQVYTVCFGVGTGMVVGATKILFGAGLIYFIMLKYAVALTLTTLISEDFVNIAWDSAGVTTGPVTVPFVLSVGVGCSKAVQASEGFGILACASVWPIISVLAMEGIRRLVRAWGARGHTDGRSGRLRLP